MVLNLILSALFVLVGLVGLIGVILSVRSFRTVFSAGISRLDGLESGRVGVVGEVEARQGLIDAPLSGKKCVGYVLDREVKHRSGGTGLGLLFPQWHPKSIHFQLPPMHLTNESGDVRLEFETDVSDWRRPDPNGLYSDFRPGVDDRIRFQEASSPPEAVQDILGDVPDVSSAGAVWGSGSNPHRYTEWRLEPGDEVYVLGRASSDATEPVVQVRIDDDVLLNYDSTSRFRLLGLYSLRLLAALSLAVFGFGIPFFLL